LTEIFTIRKFESILKNMLSMSPWFHLLTSEDSRNITYSRLASEYVTLNTDYLIELSVERRCVTLLCYC